MTPDKRAKAILKYTHGLGADLYNPHGPAAQHTAKATAAERDRLAATVRELVPVLRNAEKWLGKMIADGGHENASQPQHAVHTLEAVSAAIARAEQE